MIHNEALLLDKFSAEHGDIFNEVNRVLCHAKIEKNLGVLKCRQFLIKSFKTLGN